MIFLGKAALTSESDVSKNKARRANKYNFISYKC